MRLNVLLALSLLLVIAACDSPKSPASPSPAPDPGAAQDAAASTKSASPDVREPLLWQLTSDEPPKDERLMDIVTQALEQCAMEQGAKAPACQDPAVLKELEDSSKSQGAQLLAPLVIALSSDDLGARRVAAWMLNAYMGSILRDKEQLDSVGMQQSYARLAELLTQSRAELGPLIAPIFTALSIRLKRFKHLRALVEAHPIPAVAEAAYRSLMIYDRIETFSLVQHLVEDGDLKTRRAALSAPHQLETWSADESAQICPWATRILESGEEQLWGGASLLLRRCGPAAYDLLLDHTRSQLVHNRLEAEPLASLDYLCGSSGMRDISVPQCEHLRALQEKILSDEGFSINIRVQALRQLQHQWPDEQTASMAASVLKHAPLGLLTKEAQELLERRGDDKSKRAIKSLREREAAAQAAKP